MGETVNFEISLSDGYKLAEGVGEVVWRRSESQGPERPAGMALRFTALDQQGRDLILKILEEQVKGGGEPFEVDAIPPDAETVSSRGEALAGPDVDDSEEPTLVTTRTPAPAVTDEGGEGARHLAEAGLQRHLDFDAPWGKALPDLPSEVLDDSGSSARSVGAATDVLAARPPEEAVAELPGHVPTDAPTDSVLESTPKPRAPESDAVSDAQSLSFAAQLDAAAAEASGVGVEGPELPVVPAGDVDLVESGRSERVVPTRESAQQTPGSPPEAPPAAGEGGGLTAAVPRRQETFLEPSAVSGEVGSSGPLLEYDATPGDDGTGAWAAKGSRRSVTGAILMAAILVLSASAYLLKDRVSSWLGSTGTEAVEERQPQPVVQGGDRGPGHRASGPDTGGLPAADGSKPGAPETPGVSLAAPPTAADVLVQEPPAAAERLESRSPEPPSFDGSFASRILEISWKSSRDGTLVTIGLDGRLPADHLLHDRLTWAPTKEQLILIGIQHAYYPATTEVGTAELERIRTGSHSGSEGPEIRLVFDFPASGPELDEPRATDTGLEVLVRRPASR